MRVVYDFACGSGHKFEALVPFGTKETPCRFCDTVASRLLSSPTIKLEGITGAFPSAYDRWTRIHEQGSHLYKRGNGK